MTREDVYKVLSDVPRETVGAFIEWHREHPDVWKYFLLFAIEAYLRGIKHYGAKGIMERVRWECEVITGKGFKVNNNFTAYYARLAAWKDSRLKGFFEFRQVTGLKEAA